MVAFPNTTAQPLFVSITAEGTVEGTSAIQRAGNKYTFTSNLEQASIVIEASNIVLDGAGFTLQGEIYKINGNNVEIKNLKINSPATAIEIYGSNCKITNNEIQAEYGGIRIRNTNNHIISGNKIDAKVEAGIAFGTSSYNTVTENTIATSIMVGGVDLVSSDYNTFSRNTIHFISLYKSSYNILDENNLPQGISIRNKSNYNNITDNYIVDFNELTEKNFMSSGSITIERGEGNLVSSNTIVNSGGIFITTSSNNVLRNNSISGKGIGFEVSGSPQPSLSSFINDIDDSNTINGKKIYYLIDKSDLSINPSTYPNIGYLALVNCKRITVENIYLNTQGILLAWTTDSQIKNNDISNNYGDGVTLTHALKNKITNNNIDSNNATGIGLSYSSQTIISGNQIARNQIGISLMHLTENNTISENNIADQDIGIRFQSSSSNLIYHNNFVNNTKQVYDVGWEGIGQPFPGIPLPSENIWDNDYPAGGNYWSDNIGSETYVIDENNVDHYPQAQQITFSALAPTPTPTVPEFSSWTILLLLSIILTTSGLLVYDKKHKRSLVNKV
jgi:parallel beta-helix repeat protein